MDTLPLDPNTFLRENLASDAAVLVAESGSASGPQGVRAGAEPTKLGHVHLRVGDLAQAEDFYVNKIGFDKTFQFGDQALFVSAGGYHHHIGMNTWHSAGAGPRTPSRGLARFEIQLPTADDVAALRARLQTSGIATEEPAQTELAAAKTSATTGSFRFRDPWANEIVVTVDA